MTPLLPFLLFAFVASITPGPTNLLAMSNSARFGWRASLPIVWGGCLASAALVLAVGLGLGSTLLASPELAHVLGYAGALWLSYLGWQIARAPVTLDANLAAERAVSGWTAAFLQLINPKPWTVALAVVSVFMASAGAPAWILALLFLLIAVPCMLLWAWLGLQAGRWLHSPRGLRRFNQLMGVLLAGSGWLGLLA
ncbi:Threonine/homoserine/homoserine lactone efflux protein [Halopseudomonas sabulinigri]|uniref:Threonine/homoserine/homoserine lactone efflux protein n=1 Tax=Halopseudomonas sabulinigri TaxID=472181 RepID=A0A1H1LCK9_9GAMM|nr:LysE family translocator [Halopseudomonas sabulinigri]SDR72294.1 Threonine/homoserine/homoserine lactone efflux protein [Halopseudomonas sabulinigri]